MACIVRDNIPTPRFDCQLKEHLIVWVLEHRAPEEEYLMQVGFGTHKVEKVCDISRGQTERIPVLVQSLLIFENQWDG
jgi:hypothetical protein